MLKVNITLVMVDQDLPLSAPASFSSLLSQALAADGVTVVATATDPANPEFILPEGDYIFQSSGLDDAGRVIGNVFTMPLPVNESLIVGDDPGTPATHAVSLPGGATYIVSRP